jgi:hypothetical protein
MTATASASVFRLHPTSWAIQLAGLSKLAGLSMKPYTIPPAFHAPQIGCRTHCRSGCGPPGLPLLSFQFVHNSLPPRQAIQGAARAVKCPDSLQKCEADWAEGHRGLAKGLALVCDIQWKLPTIQGNLELILKTPHEGSDRLASSRLRVTGWSSKRSPARPPIVSAASRISPTRSAFRVSHVRFPGVEVALRPSSLSNQFVQLNHKHF